MDQENSFIEENSENSLKDEKLKKIFVILVTLAFVSGVYYYTSLSNTKTAKAPLETVQPVNNELPKNIQPPKEEIKKTETKEIAVNKIQTDNKLSQEIKPDIKQETPEIVPNKKTNKIKPTDKALMIKSALLASGKPDPFTTNTSKPISPEEFKSYLPKYLGKNSLSSPNSLKNLPSISSLPNINLPNSNFPQNPYNMSFNEPEIKGFIGNKVIMSINGVSESLKVNESFQGIKVVKIDPINMSVKFIQDKKVITKNIKSIN